MTVAHARVSNDGEFVLTFNGPAPQNFDGAGVNVNPIAMPGHQPSGFYRVAISDRRSRQHSRKGRMRICRGRKQGRQYGRRDEIVYDN